MKTTALAVCLTLLLFAAVPVQAQTTPPALGVAQLSDAQRTEIEKILTEFHKEIFALVNQHSSAGYEKYLSESFQEKVGSGSTQAVSKAPFLKWLDNIFSQRESQTISPYKIKVSVLSPDVAYSLYVGGAQITMKNGRKGGYGNAMTYIWRKESGGWRIIHMHESTW